MAVNGRFDVKRQRGSIGVVAVIAAVWMVNTNVIVELPESQSPRLLSHRGVHQTNGGTANPIAPLTHQFIENTLPSMRAAVGFGADVIELDVHLTPDNVFAVFHDWTVDCRTDGQGVTDQIPFSVLRSLDVGYGYSVDGKTFPLRGTGVGLMPSLSEVLAANLGAKYLINFKSKNPLEGMRLAEMFDDPANANANQIWGVYGGEIPTQEALARSSGLRGFDRGSLKSCLMSDLALGWSGYVPATRRDGLVAVPLDYAPYLWGWPHKFTQRMNAAGSDVILWGPYDGRGFSRGVDDAETWARVPTQFGGYVWTNKIEVIGLLAETRNRS